MSEVVGAFLVVIFLVLFGIMSGYFISEGIEKNEVCTYYCTKTQKKKPGMATWDGNRCKCFLIRRKESNVHNHREYGTNSNMTKVVQENIDWIREVDGVETKYPTIKW